MMGRNGKIQTLEKEIETVRNEVRTSQESQVGRKSKFRIVFDENFI
jgi:hypothetical protein